MVQVLVRLRMLTTLSLTPLLVAICEGERPCTTAVLLKDPLLARLAEALGIGLERAKRVGAKQTARFWTVICR